MLCCLCEPPLASAAHVSADEGIPHGTGTLESPLQPNKFSKRGKTGSSHIPYAFMDIHNQSPRQGEKPISVPDAAIVTSTKKDQRKPPFRIQYSDVLPKASALSGLDLSGDSTDKEARVSSTKPSCLDIPPSLARVGPSILLPSPKLTSIFKIYFRQSGRKPTQ